MEYAIVDIETTGGHAASNGITEISIQVHNGKQVTQVYETLINPGYKIPYYIKGLTGITDEMVADAPTFDEVAADVWGILAGRVFVAHSVNFDYSFVKAHLAASGYDLNSKKLCTIRLSRKIFPGASSYGLGKICGFVGIEIDNRHRAGGDARATVELFEMMLERDTEGLIQKSLKKNSKEQSLPPNVPREQFDVLPTQPGVYFFKNNKGKVVYVGKAKNIKKRVSSHFSNNATSKQKQEFMRSIHSISFEICGSELMALLLESHEIKRLWPAFNRSQKRFEPVFGIVDYYDQPGYRRLALSKISKGTKPLIAFSNMIDGLGVLRRLSVDFELCPRLSGLANTSVECEDKKCNCTNRHAASIKTYNTKVESAVLALAQTESFVITQQGRTKDEAGIVVVESGAFTRMGYLPSHHLLNGFQSAEMLQSIPVYRENFNIRNIIAGYKRDFPETIRQL